MFNAGWCHSNGVGTNTSHEKGKAYYELAANKFGHFACIHELGKLHYQGLVRSACVCVCVCILLSCADLFMRILCMHVMYVALFQGTPRSLRDTYRYMSAVAGFGPWAGDIRKVRSFHSSSLTHLCCVCACDVNRGCEPLPPCSPALRPPQSSHPHRLCSPPPPFPTIRDLTGIWTGTTTGRCCGTCAHGGWATRSPPPMRATCLTTNWPAQVCEPFASLWPQRRSVMTCTGFVFGPQVWCWACLLRRAAHPRRSLYSRGCCMSTPSPRVRVSCHAVLLRCPVCVGVCLLCVFFVPAEVYVQCLQGD